MALWRVLDKTSAPLRGAVKHRLTTRLNSVKRQTQSRERRKRAFALQRERASLLALVERATESSAAQKSLCLVVFSVKAQNKLSDLKYTFLVVANNNKMIDYLSKRTIKLF